MAAQKVVPGFEPGIAEGRITWYSGVFKICRANRYTIQPPKQMLFVAQQGVVEAQPRSGRFIKKNIKKGKRKNRLGMALTRPCPFCHIGHFHNAWRLINGHLMIHGINTVENLENLKNSVSSDHSHYRIHSRGFTLSFLWTTMRRHGSNAADRYYTGVVIAYTRAQAASTWCWKLWT